MVAVTLLKFETLRIKVYVSLKSLIKILRIDEMRFLLEKENCPPHHFSGVPCGGNHRSLLLQFHIERPGDTCIYLQEPGDNGGWVPSIDGLQPYEVSGDFLSHHLLQERIS